LLRELEVRLSSESKARTTCEQRFENLSKEMVNLNSSIANFNMKVKQLSEELAATEKIKKELEKAFNEARNRADHAMGRVTINNKIQ
jgi:predicted  nucleic acid-binding Zn-ribbon protein